MSNWEQTLDEVEKMKAGIRERSMMYQGHARLDEARFMDLPATAMDDVDFDKVWSTIIRPFKDMAEKWHDEGRGPKSADEWKAVVPTCDPTRIVMIDIWVAYKRTDGATAFQIAKLALISNNPCVAKAMRVQHHRRLLYYGMCEGNAKVVDIDVTELSLREAEAAYAAFVKRQPLWESQGKIDGQIEKEYEETL